MLEARDEAPGRGPDHAREQAPGQASEAGPGDVAAWVHHSAIVAPDRPALIDASPDTPERRLTWAELDAAVDRVAAGFARVGLVAGYRVALTLPNSVEFVAAYFGALRAGLVAVPLNPTSPPAELERQLAEVGARWVLAEPAAVEDLMRTEPDVPPVPPPDPEALAVLQFTSGTSGSPRAAMLSHRALLANLDQMARIDPPAMRPDDVVLGLVPFCHIFGSNAVLGLAARTGATLVLTDRFDPEGTLDLIAAHGVTNVPVPPQVLAAWTELDLRDRLSSVRLLLSGAAPLPVEVAERLEAATGLVVHQGYGLTEASPTVATTLCSAARETGPEPGSVGSALPGVEVRTAERDVPESVDDPSEILVRGPNLFSGYWPDGADGPDPDGWLATGDLGYLDDDGDLFLLDRSKELVLVSGFNVYPREVEAVIAEFPGVAEVAVVGRPDERTGEAVVAYVVPESATGAETPSETGGITPEAIVAHCRERLARFKCPASVELVAELPRSATGKIRKARLR